MQYNKNVFASALLFILFISGCNNNNKAQYKSPAGYDLNKPEKFEMNNVLKEISGITFLNGNADSTFAIEDEKGKLYSFSIGKEKMGISKFGKKGDFEDVTLLNNNTIVVLRSDGSFFLFPVAEAGMENIDSVKEYDNILPPGEYEGLASADGKIFALCKNCSGDKEKKEVSIYTIEQAASGTLSVTNSFKIDISLIQKDASEPAKFHPSGIAKNPLTKEWYIVSSVNKLLLVLDEQWKLKEFYPLDPSLFKQPEGMAFNDKGDLYISNEGGEGTANILLFRYQPH